MGLLFDWSVLVHVNQIKIQENNTICQGFMRNDADQKLLVSEDNFIINFLFLRLPNVFSTSLYSSNPAPAQTTKHPDVRPLEDIPGVSGKSALPYVGSIFLSKSLGICLFRFSSLH